jgi:hypothetical protein
VAYAQDGRVLADSPSFIGSTEEDAAFVEHRHDQSILSLLARKWGVQPFAVPFEAFADDVRNAAALIDKVPQDEEKLARAAKMQVTLRLKGEDGEPVLFYFPVLERNAATIVLDYCTQDLYLTCPGSVAELKAYEWQQHLLHGSSDSSDSSGSHSSNSGDVGRDGTV